MAPIDLTKQSAHALLDRKARLHFIEMTIGFGVPQYVCPSSYDVDATMTLTDTGVIAIRSKSSNNLITAYISEVKQAAYVFHNSEEGKTMKRMPERLWERVHYNNNTATWRRMETAHA